MDWLFVLFDVLLLCLRQDLEDLVLQEVLGLGAQAQPSALVDGLAAHEQPHGVLGRDSLVALFRLYGCRTLLLERSQGVGDVAVGLAVRAAALRHRGSRQVRFIDLNDRALARRVLRLIDDLSGARGRDAVGLKLVVQLDVIIVP